MILFKRFVKPCFFFLIVILSFSCTTRRPTAAESAKAYYNLGNAYTELGKNSEAEKAYVRAREIDPSYLNAGYNLARVYITLHQYDRAMEELDNILEKDEKNRSVKELKAWVFHLQGQDDKALEIYNSVIEDFDASQNSLYNSAMILAGEENYEEALSRYKKIYDIYEDENVVFQIGNMYYQLGSNQDAISWFEKHIEDEPEDFVTLELLGDVYVESSLYIEAVDTYRKMTKIKDLKSDILGRSLFKSAKIEFFYIEDLDEGITFLKDSVKTKWPTEEDYKEILEKVDKEWVKQIEDAIATTKEELEKAAAEVDDSKE